MDKTKSGNTTPGGRPVEKLENPPSKEAGSTDSGESQLLLGKESLRKREMDTRSILRGETKTTHTPERANEELQNMLSRLEQHIELLNR